MSAVLQAREAWLDERRTGIGGSDVAAILGLSPWKSPLEVYLDKIGEAPEQDDNAAMAWGRALEPLIRQAYEAQTGRTILVPTASYVHPQHSFMRANLDGEIPDECLGFEAKTARTGEGWGEPGSAEIPDAYALQVQHYMLVRGYVAFDVAVLIGGSDFRTYTVPADPDLQAMLVDAETAFWQQVEARIPPEPRTYAETVIAYGRSANAGLVEADEDAAAAWMRLKEIRAQLKDLETQEDAARAEIARAIGERGDTLTSHGKTLATWKLAKAAERFDTAAFKAAHPELAAQYMRAGEPSRRMLIKD